MGFWTWGLSFSLNWGACPVGTPIFILVAFGGNDNFSFGMTLHHHINLLCSCLAPCWVNTTYNHRVFSSGVDITMAGCLRLILGAFCSYTGCRGRSSDSSLPWTLCPAYFCCQRKLLDDLFHIAILWNNRLKGRDHILTTIWILEALDQQPQTKIYYFILLRNGNFSILHQGLNGTSLIIAGTF